MSKHARRPAASDLAPAGQPFARPGIEDCLFHRCARHEEVPMLNGEEEQTSAECGGCIAEGTIVLLAQNLLILDGYADRLAYSHALRQKLEAARERLNLLAPGAGDFLNEDDDASDAT